MIMIFLTSFPETALLLLYENRNSGKLLNNDENMLPYLFISMRTLLTFHYELQTFHVRKLPISCLLADFGTAVSMLCTCYCLNYVFLKGVLSYDVSTANTHSLKSSRQLKKFISQI